MSQQSTNSVVHEAGHIEGLKKTKFSLIGMIFLLYCMCAGGAFGIEAMIPSAGPGLTILVLILTSVLWALPICIYVSELTCFAPVDSGPYVWMKMAFGEFWGFNMGWWIALASFLSPCGYIVIAAGYLGKIMDLTPTMAIVVKVGFVVILTIVNLLGLREVSTLSTIFCIIILVAFAGVTVVGFMNWNVSPVTPFIPEGQGVIASLGGALSIGIWMYAGYPGISFLGGEIENPGIIPKALKITLAIITLSYVLPTVAGLCSVGEWSSWTSGVGEGTVNYSSVLYNFVGPWAGVAFAVAAIIAQIAITNGAIASASRSFMVLGEDRLSPKFLNKLSKRGVPSWAILLLGLITIIFVNFDFSVIITIMTPLMFVLYVSLAFAFVKMRKKYPVEERGGVYYAKGGKLLIAYIGIVPAIVGVLAMLVNGTEYFLLGFIGIGSSLVAYIVFKLIYGGFAKNDPVKYPINPKTKMAKGDIPRFGIYFLIFGILAFLGSFFLGWYEGSWGTEYYMETYGSGIMSNFWAMVEIARWGGAGSIVVGLLCYFLGKKYDKE